MQIWPNDFPLSLQHTACLIPIQSSNESPSIFSHSSGGVNRQLPLQRSKDPAPFQSTWLYTRAPETQALPRRHHPGSTAAALPGVSSGGPGHRRHAWAPIHHLPGGWVRSLSTDRQLPLTMGKPAALPERLWQQEEKKKKSAERICKIAAHFGCNCYYVSSQLNDHTQ